MFAVVATLCLFTACGNKADDSFVSISSEDLSQTVICPRQVLLQELDRDVDVLITCDTEYYVQLPEPLGYRGAEYWRFSSIIALANALAFLQSTKPLASHKSATACCTSFWNLSS